MCLNYFYFKHGEVIKFEEQKDSAAVPGIFNWIDTALVILKQNAICLIWHKVNHWNKIKVNIYDGKLVPMKYQTVINAAGPWASHIARLACIGIVSIETYDVNANG